MVGPMGAGKTTIGKKLAELCHLQFVDSDHEIELRTGVDIPYIFEREGEPGFRERERQVIADLVLQPGIVLSTGGGAVLDAHSRTDFKSHGFVVYLHASVDQQHHRTERAENRPLLAKGDRRATLERLFLIRDPLYREVADLVVATDGRNSRQIAREIAEAWSAAGVET